jgi:hypothetical protein
MVRPIRCPRLLRHPQRQSPHGGHAGVENQATNDEAAPTAASLLGPPDAPCLTLEGLHRPIELAGQERHQDGAAVQEEVSDG